MSFNQMVLTNPNAHEFKALVFNYRPEAKSFSVYGQTDLNKDGQLLDSIDLEGESSRVKYIPEIDETLQDALEGGYVLKQCWGTVAKRWEQLGWNLCDDINGQISKAGSNKSILGAYLIRKDLIEDNRLAPEGVLNPNITVTFDPGQACPIW